MDICTWCAQYKNETVRLHRSELCVHPWKALYTVQSPGSSLGLVLILSVAGNNLDFVGFDQLLNLPELDIFQHKGPHIVAEAICAQVPRLEREPRLYPVGERIVDGLVKLKQHFQCKVWRDLAATKAGRVLQVVPV